MINQRNESAGSDSDVTLAPARVSEKTLEVSRRHPVRAFLDRRGGSLIWYVLAIALAVFIAAPIVVYHAQAFTEGADSGIFRFLSVPNLDTIILNTIVLAAGSTIIALVLGVALAKATMHIPRRLRGIATIVPLLPLVAPGVALIIGWAFMFSPTVGYGNVLLRSLPFLSDLTEGPFNVYSMPAIVFITGIDLTGIVFLLVSARLQEIRGPLEAAARVAGATGTQSFFTITLPLLRPSMVAGAAVVFLLGLGQFTAPLFLGSRRGIQVVTTTIFQLREAFPIDWAVIAALGLPLLILGIIAVVLQRTVVGDQRKYVTQTGGGAGGISERTSAWAAVLVIAYGFVAVIVPFVGVVLVALSPYWSGDLTNIAFTFRHFESAFANRTIWESVSNSVITSLVAVLIAIPIGLAAALATTGPFRAPRFAQYLFDFSFQTPLAVPRAVLGLALLYVLIRPPFSLYGTIWLFIIGYMFIVLPFVLRAQQGSLVGLSGSLFEAARLAGAGYFRTIFEIALPLIRRGIAAGASLGMMLVLHDFAVSVMLRSPGAQVMGTKLYDFWEAGVYPEVAVMSIIMSVVTAIVLVLVLWIGGRSALKSL